MRVCMLLGLVPRVFESRKQGPPCSVHEVKPPSPLQWAAAPASVNMDIIGVAGPLGWADSTYSGSHVRSTTIDSSMDSTPSSGEEGAPLRRYVLLLYAHAITLTPGSFMLHA